MELAEFCQRTRALTAPYCVTDGSKFRLKDYDPADTDGWGSGDKKRARDALALGVEALADFQEKLYAQGRHAVLLIFQGMDAAGKDGVIKHVMSGVNPQGCRVVAFKTPSPEELRHDFLWRCWRQLPERGPIGIFNRSYYEETLIVRVHPELPERQRLPAKSISRCLWQERWEDICNFERYLTRNGIVVRNFFCISQKPNRNAVFSNASTTRTVTGNSPRPTWPNAPIGMATNAPTKKPFATRPGPRHLGLWCRLTTNGLPASWWQPLLWTRCARWNCASPR